MDTIFKRLFFISAKLNGKLPIGYGTEITIGHYFDSFYTRPSDGIVRCKISWGAGAYIKAGIYDKNGNYITGIGVSNPSSGTAADPNTAIIPVFKGMKVKNLGNSSVSNGGEYLGFIPFTYL